MQRLPVDNRAVCVCAASVSPWLPDSHYVGPLLLLLVLQVPHQTPEPAPARGLRQARDQGEGGADRGGAGGPLLCSGNVNGRGTLACEPLGPCPAREVLIRSDR